ncbi:hypothetical protein AWB78_05867 [Caballeronia calidae]|uniref:Uncharacterized protein n=1 Tax=Caballeronia calidae TaxID=1777139 RepID=A0A158DZF0_9BURK|nr:hypothetical protein AWB78_05867 [Caballeronia calidae]
MFARQYQCVLAPPRQIFVYVLDRKVVLDAKLVLAKLYGSCAVKEDKAPAVWPASISGAFQLGMFQFATHVARIENLAPSKIACFSFRE